mgnify:FL=1
MRVQCLSCLGVYNDVLLDGVRYFHACPPVHLRHVQRAGTDLDVPLDQVHPTDLLRVFRAGVALDVPAAAVLASDLLLGDSFIERPSTRDENVPSTREQDTWRMKAIGLGVQPAP